jgi:hypothetical protein
LRRTLIAAFWIALAAPSAFLLFAYYNVANHTFSDFACSDWCKAAFDEVMSELRAEFDFFVLASFVMAIALFGTTILAGWLLGKMRSKLRGWKLAA